MVKEVERTFLVDFSNRPTLHCLEITQIEQGYLSIGVDGSETRLRKKDTRYAGDTSHVLTHKSAGGLSRDESETELFLGQFRDMWGATEDRRISKTRYDIEAQDDLTYELDVFKGVLAGLVLVEVEFSDVAESEIFSPPEWFGEDVTGVKLLQNQSLALNGLILDEEYTLPDGRKLAIPTVELNDNIWMSHA